MILRYREAREGQILEEGITEAGAMASFTAAGTAHASYGLTMVPFYMFYSMFGYQRVGDLVWAFGDARGRGFLLGATAGRTTLQGEGLQHDDGHSHVLFAVVPNVRAYDPAFAYELAVIIKEGLRAMIERGQDVFYYITLYNENYEMPAMPAGAEEGIVRGIYPLHRAADAFPLRAQILGSGPTVLEALRAADILAERFSVGADVWSVTSYQQLRADALETERWNRLHPTEPARVPYLTRQLADAPGPFVAASEYVKLLPDMVGRFIPEGLTPLGTDGFGLSDTRTALRRHFEVDAEHIAVAVLSALARRGAVPAELVASAIIGFGLDPDRPDPAGR
jgi:pyruvate dehydrogenase E1 component